MSARKPGLLVGASALLAMMPWGSVTACSCGPSSLEDVFALAGAVVEGRVVEVDRGYMRLTWCELVNWVDTKTGGHHEYCAVRLTLEVSKRWKGPEDDLVNIFTGRGGGDCGLPLNFGDSFLLYLYREQDGPWQTNICMRPTPSDRAADDREILTMLAQQAKAK